MVWFFIWLILSTTIFLFLSSNFFLISSCLSCNFLKFFSLFLTVDKNKQFWLLTRSNIFSFFCFPIFSALIFMCNWCLRILSFLFWISSFDFFKTSPMDLSLFSYLIFCSSKFLFFTDTKPSIRFWVFSSFKSNNFFSVSKFFSFFNLFRVIFSILSNSLFLPNNILSSLSFFNNSSNSFSLLFIFSSFSLFFLSSSFNLFNIFSFLFSYNLKVWVFLKRISFWFFSCISWNSWILLCSALYFSSFLFSLSFILFSNTFFLIFSFSLNFNSSISIFCFLSSFILSFNSFILISFLSVFILSISFFTSFSICVSIIFFCFCLIFSIFSAPFCFISVISFSMASFSLSILFFVYVWDFPASSKRSFIISFLFFFTSAIILFRYSSILLYLIFKASIGKFIISGCSFTKSSNFLWNNSSGNIPKSSHAFNERGLSISFFWPSKSMSSIDTNFFS